MGESSAVLFSNALKLSSKEREELAVALWDSLDAEAGLKATADAEFESEVSKRRQEILSGDVGTISHTELKRQLGR